METYRSALLFLLVAISVVLYSKWLDFSAEHSQPQTQQDVVVSEVPEYQPPTDTSVPSNDQTQSVPSLSEEVAPPKQSNTNNAPLIRVETDLVIATINTAGGVIERIEMKNHPVQIDQPDIGYPVLRKNTEETFVVQDGLLVPGNKPAPNHLARYEHEANNYDLGNADTVSVPLKWVNEQGQSITKIISFKRDSYLVNIDYVVENQSDAPWTGYLYAQFNRTEPTKKSGGFGQLPSYTGGAIYTEEEKYEKVDFGDMDSANLSRKEKGGWVSMMEHYFVTVLLPTTENNTFFSRKAGANYLLGIQSNDPLVIAAGEQGTLGTSVFLGPKEQSRLRAIKDEKGVTGLPLTVDYGALTFIADPLFWLLEKIHGVVKNWGWSIILLTLLIKIVFYPLSAASYKSMAGMKKLQPRIQTLKERYKDDRQKFQMEMMELYKKEKINPAGGCLPILIQIPVFIALYWVLLESVEIRQAPFALWLTDLSAPDPFYVLPILMGASMWAQQKLNPAPMDDIQKRVMMIMPFALTLLFLTFPAGLVLYWVVNNVLSMAQQWFINKKHAQ